MKIYRNEVWIEKMCSILENLRKTFFLPEKNPTSIFKIGGILGKKMFREFLGTSVIISLWRGDARYLSKKFQKLF